MTLYFSNTLTGKDYRYRVFSPYFPYNNKDIEYNSINKDLYMYTTRYTGKNIINKTIKLTIEKFLSNKNIITNPIKYRF